MEIEKVYIQAVQLLNSNMRNQVELTQPAFVLFFNIAQLEYLETIIELGRNSDRVQKVQKFLVDANLKLKTKTDLYFQYNLPEDFFRRETITVKANQGACSDYLYGITEVKPSDVPYRLADEFSKPSFDFRETIYYFRSNSVIIYGADQFNIDNVNLVYYRKPKEVDLVGYIHDDGKASKNVDTEWEQEHITDILKILVDKYTKAKMPTKEV